MRKISGRRWAWALPLLAALLAPAARSAQWTVGPGAKHATVASALAAARVGDRIVVKPGTYKETLIWPKVQGIQLVSEKGAEATILQGDGKHPVIRMAGKLKWDTLLEGFTIRGGGAGYGRGEFGAGLNIVEASPTIRNCIITGNRARPYRGTGGVFLWNSRAVLEHNTISRNGYQDGSLHAGGLCVWGGMPKIRHNRIEGNAGGDERYFTRGAGVRLQGARAVLRGNVIRENISTSVGSALYSARADLSCVFGNEITANRNVGGSYGALAVEPNSDPRIGGARPGEANAIHDNIHAWRHAAKSGEQVRNLNAKWLGRDGRAVRANAWGGTDEETLAKQLAKVPSRPKASREAVRVEDAGPKR